ncbi:Tryptophan--tRNA ligase [Candidatus Bealeia paramacronuclearis]|uniref:Tryptophan--tRNA ligase n=2 Tax=Candidatus Bealeia paramacronuclearis TaxID=1921001 RepID=A0ABZ2C3L9_9PROT|nr:Tryptophan--tRNA ligase [Candidatus Bealeia paramacronuclearis]
MRILSGVQPTGSFHLGNYLGAIKNWVKMQDQGECLFLIVDLHSLTTHPQASELKASVRSVAAAYMASGIDPEKSFIFPQSAVMQHTELAWILGCGTPLGWLNRMTQFKEKAGKQKDMANLGLYAYPVLQAADILLYQATHVPVGEDQKQHLELARDIAGAFNRNYEEEYFVLPEPVIPPESARIMSLRDGTSKMSKSDPSDYSRINLSDDDETIRLKIRKAKTDPEPIGDTVESMEARPEAINLLSIYSALSEMTLKDTIEKYKGASFSTLKSDLAELTISVISPIRSRMIQLLENPEKIDQVLARGGAHARKLAETHMTHVYELIGIEKV